LKKQPVVKEYKPDTVENIKPVSEKQIEKLITIHNEKITSISEPKEVKPVTVIEKQPVVKTETIDNIKQNDKPAIQEKVAIKPSIKLIEKPKSVDFKPPTTKTAIKPTVKQLSEKSQNDSKSDAKPLLRSNSDNVIKASGVKKLRATFEAKK